MIYLDNNATTRIDPRVMEAMREAWLSGPLNASSQHQFGRSARKRLDDASQRIARQLGADIHTTGADQLILTSGGTEANNWIFDQLLPGDLPRLVSRIEHPSVLALAEQRMRDGLPTEFIEVDRSGVIRVDSLREKLAALAPTATSTVPATNAPVGLVSVMAANNETGVVQPIETIGELCQEFGFWLHTDATQWIGKLPFNFAALHCHAATFAAHKFHGPVGFGGVLLKGGLKLKPWFAGGGQQLGIRPGTEAIPLAVGCAIALEIANEHYEADTDRITALRDHMEQSLLEAIPNATVHGADVARLPNTINMSFPDVDRQTLLILLDRCDIACSTGSACSSGSSEPSHVLAAMKVPPEQIDSALRFGLSRFSTADEIQLAIERILLSLKKLRSG